MTEPTRDPEAIVDALDHPVLVFDGVCNLCNWSVRTVVRADDEGRFRFAQLQSDVGAALLARHGHDPASLDSVVLVDGEDCYRKSTAVIEVCRRLGLPWSMLVPFRYVPEVVRDRVYDLVARYRYDLFGRSVACQVPKPALRERFLARALDDTERGVTDTR